MAGGFRKFKSRKQEQKVMMLLQHRHGGGAELEEHIKKKQQTHVNQQTVNILVTKKRRIAVLDKLAKKDVVVSDDEVQHITNSLNRRQFSNDENREFGDEARRLVKINPEGIKLDEDFTKKGLEFLTRTNIQKQLGNSERHVVDTFKEFHLVGWFEESNQFRSFFKPEFRVVANDGETFEYTLGEDVRKINITG